MDKAKTPPPPGGMGETPKEPGFLPFYTNAFDRVFIGAVILIGIHLLWLRFMEPALPIEVATVISLVIGFYVVRRG